MVGAHLPYIVVAYHKMNFGARVRLKNLLETCSKTCVSGEQSS